MPTLTLDGTDLYYEDDGAGVPVLLVHGMGLDSRMWIDQVEALGSECRMIRPDLRGFGRSPRDPLIPYSHTDDLVALLDYVGIDDVVLVGLSMGGMVALELVLAHPDRIRSLVLLDSVVDELPFDPDIAAEYGKVRPAMASEGIAAARRNFLDCGWFGPAQRDPSVAARLRAMVDGYGGSDWAGDDPHTESGPVYQRLGELDLPTTVVAGELDVPSFLEMARMISEQIPNARHVVIPDVGHMVNMEAPEAINALLYKVLSDFVDR
jgi:3-oxoadipate enol-lactonase